MRSAGLAKAAAGDAVGRRGFPCLANARAGPAFGLVTARGAGRTASCTAAPVAALARLIAGRVVPVVIATGRLGCRGSRTVL